MPDNPCTTRPLWITGLAIVLAILAGIPILLLGTLYETWAALTIWAWFAPWPVPVNLATATGLTLAVHLVFRSSASTHGETSREWAVRMIMFYIVGPTLVLLSAWILWHIVQ